MRKAMLGKLSGVLTASSRPASVALPKNFITAAFSKFSFVSQGMPEKSSLRTL